MKTGSDTKGVPLDYEAVCKSAEGMFGIDSHGKILFWNSSAEAILGISAHDAIGKSCFDIVKARDLAGNLFCFNQCAVITMARKGEPIHNYETEVVTKTGEKIPLNTSIFLIFDPKSKEPVVVHLFRKIPVPNGKPLEHFPSGNVSQTGPPANSKFLFLTAREREILKLMAQSLVAKEIADRLNISVETARKHIKKVLKKLGAHSKLEAVIRAMQEGLLP